MLKLFLMKQKILDQVDKDRYQVFILKCPVSLPAFMAVHTWFVVNNYGNISRWEVVFRKNRGKIYKGYLNKNLLEPFMGISFIFFINGLHWKASLVSVIEGDKAKEIGNFIESSFDNYKNIDYYKFLGPNSNTYVQWVLDNFPELKIELPKNAIGKNFK